MRFILILISALFLSVVAKSQHYHFFYIQSDQQQPFYIKMGKEVMSSSSAGFLIIPKLKDSAFEMIVGFPQNQFPEYRFSIASVKKDRGLMLKNYVEKGWGLFDLNSMETIMGEKINRVEQAKVKVPEPLTADVFTAILATVIDDPGLLATELVLREPSKASYASNAVVLSETQQAKKAIDKPVVSAKKPVTEKNVTANKQVLPPVRQMEETKETQSKKSETEIAVIDKAAGKETTNEKNIESITKSSESKVVDTVKETVGQKMVLSPSQTMPITPHVGNISKTGKISETDLGTSLELVFTDLSASGKVDTIMVLLEKETVVSLAPALPEKSITEVTPAVDSVSKTSVSIAKEKIEPAPAVKEAVPEKGNDITLPGARKSTRAACSKISSEKDVSALRRRMVGLKDEDDMISLALKDFKQKCYTSDQVKTISFVFVREEGRYKLLDAAYPYVYDPDNYVELESLLNEPYFIYRFKALIRMPSTKLP